MSPIIFSLMAVFAACAAWAAPLRGEEVIAVVSSDLEYYDQALEGFREVFGPVAVYKATDALTFYKKPKVAVAFGRRAALRSQSLNTKVIYCMAPGAALESSTQISILPKADTVAQKLKEIQPALQRLAVLYQSAAFNAYLRDLRKFAGKLGITVRTVAVPSPDDLPNKLRSITTNAQAFLLMPDPPLITDQSLDILKEFSWHNKIPYYAVTAGLLDRGATAAVSVDFKEFGRAAARAAQKALAGAGAGPEIFSEQYEVTVNRLAAEAVGLAFPKEAATQAGNAQP